MQEARDASLAQRALCNNSRSAAYATAGLPAAITVVEAASDRVIQLGTQLTALAVVAAEDEVAAVADATERAKPATRSTAIEFDNIRDDLLVRGSHRNSIDIYINEMHRYIPAHRWQDAGEDPPIWEVWRKEMARSAKGASLYWAKADRQRMRAEVLDGVTEFLDLAAMGSRTARYQPHTTVAAEDEVAATATESLRLHPDNLIASFQAYQAEMGLYTHYWPGNFWINKFGEPPIWAVWAFEVADYGDQVSAEWVRNARDLRRAEAIESFTNYLDMAADGQSVARYKLHQALHGADIFLRHQLQFLHCRAAD